jgi:hypothetical protein
VISPLAAWSDPPDLPDPHHLRRWQFTAFSMLSAAAARRHSTLTPLTSGCQQETRL